MTTDLGEYLPERVKRVGVNVGEHEAGILSKEAHASFFYTNKDYPVSLTMPYRELPYNHGVVHPIFAQNLPEGFLRRYIHEKLLRYAQVDDMYLLALMKDKGVGHLSYPSEVELPDAEGVALDEILHWHESQPLFPQLLERFYLNGMASGVQPKVMVARATVLQNDVIVKTYDEEFPLLTVNEFVCMKCAQSCGFEVPQVWLSDNFEHYVVERFDTLPSGEKLGIEDFATLLGRSGDEKYKGSYENILKATRLNTGSLSQVENVFKLIAFNCLIGNGDAHLKNFSLVYESDFNNIRLSPVYDVTHTLIYPEIDNSMALKMRKSRSFPNRQQLVEFAYSAGIPTRVAADLIDQMADNLNDCLSALAEAAAMPGLKESMLKHLSAVMHQQHVKKVYRHEKKRKYR
ncbi:type II toxin-antitoxin system HipA family toxin [Idiomarina seosinensis]|uniref:Type II toxin-antitoxin system HipA family toxin n=1 Tax=Idiomarina seosinensis TaxID=281739 RepID=A0A432ZGD9_9GAMM|nr:type II toxin-antitoxin system HipA family toxin [Idiomarina seosinensis]RUO76989.1 type II toxin-antitoxin system HipA family toxin [Idiomarina seosinensis]